MLAVLCVALLRGRKKRQVSSAGLAALGDVAAVVAGLVAVATFAMPLLGQDDVMLRYEGEIGKVPCDDRSHHTQLRRTLNRSRYERRVMFLRLWGSDDGYLSQNQDREIEFPFGCFLFGGLGEPLTPEPFNVYLRIVDGNGQPVEILNGNHGWVELSGYFVVEHFESLPNAGGHERFTMRVVPPELVRG